MPPSAGSISSIGTASTHEYDVYFDPGFSVSIMSSPFYRQKHSQMALRVRVGANYLRTGATGVLKFWQYSGSMYCEYSQHLRVLDA